MTMTEQPQPLTAPEYIGLVHMAAQVGAEPGTDWDVACERAARPNTDAACNGEGKAEWALWFVCGCSPMYVLYCTRCKDNVLKAEDICCSECGGLWSPGSTAYALVEPLNRTHS